MPSLFHSLCPQEVVVAPVRDFNAWEFQSLYKPVELTHKVQPEIQIKLAASALCQFFLLIQTFILNLVTLFIWHKVRFHNKVAEEKQEIYSFMVNQLTSRPENNGNFHAFNLTAVMTNDHRPTDLLPTFNGVEII